MPCAESDIRVSRALPLGVVEPFFRRSVPLIVQWIICSPAISIGSIEKIFFRVNADCLLTAIALVAAEEVR